MGGSERRVKSDPDAASDAKANASGGAVVNMEARRKTRTWNRGDHLGDLQAVQDGRLPRIVEAQNQNAHFLDSTQLGEYFRE